MAIVQQKTKAQKALAAQSGGKAKKKKWSKGRQREKVASKVLFDQETYDRLRAEVPKMKLITPSAIVERLKTSASLARAALRNLAAEGLIKAVSVHSTQAIYTRSTGSE